MNSSPNPWVSAPWATEGPDGHGIDRWLGFQHTGNNDAWIRDASTNWNALTQAIAVKPNTKYTLTGWIRNNFGTNVGYFGVRDFGGFNVVAQTTFGAAAGYTKFTVNFDSGSNTTMTVFAGFWGQGVDTWMQLDDVSVMPTSPCYQVVNGGEGCPGWNPDSAADAQN